MRLYQSDVVRQYEGLIPRRDIERIIELVEMRHPVPRRLDAPMRSEAYLRQVEELEFLCLDYVSRRDL